MSAGPMTAEPVRHRADLGAMAVVAAAVLLTSAYANYARATGDRGWLAFVPPFRAGLDANMVDHLGGEYGSIARALVEGRGFADPFNEPTGPTAWMPPVLPYLQAALLALVGEKATVVAVVLLQDFALVVAGWVAIRGVGGGRPFVVAATYLALTWYHFSACYQITHDCWLILLLLSLMVALAGRLWDRGPSLRLAVGWGAFGGLAALTGPVLGLVWGTITLTLAIAHRRASWLALSAVVALLVVSPWVARNYQVLGRFIPVKSNLAFEWYQSNKLEPDGVLRFETGATHPYRGSGEERIRYKELGEIRYLDEYRSKAMRALSGDPVGYLARVGSRLLAATVIYFPFQADESGVGLWLSYAIHPLPFYGLMAMIFLGQWRSDRRKVVAVISYVTYLFPYMMVAYYERYSVPLIGLQAMFCCWGWEAILSASRWSKARSAVDGVGPRDSP